MTPEEELLDFEPDEEFWQAYFKWADACNAAADEQYYMERNGGSIRRGGGQLVTRSR